MGNILSSGEDLVRIYDMISELKKLRKVANKQVILYELIGEQKADDKAEKLLTNIDEYLRNNLQKEVYSKIHNNYNFGTRHRKNYDNDNRLWLSVITEEKKLPEYIKILKNIHETFNISIAYSNYDSLLYDGSDENINEINREIYNMQDRYAKYIMRIIRNCKKYKKLLKGKSDEESKKYIIDNCDELLKTISDDFKDLNYEDDEDDDIGNIRLSMRQHFSSAEKKSIEPGLEAKELKSNIPEYEKIEINFLKWILEAKNNHSNIIGGYTDFHWHRYVLFLVVKCKGLIPLNEELFPKSIMLGGTNYELRIR